MDNFYENINEVISKLSTQTKNIVVIGSGEMKYWDNFLLKVIC